MADIAPLTPLRYDLGALALANLVAPPYDVISPKEREELAARDPHNVVRLILPEGEGDTKYAHAAQLLADWVGSGVLVRDTEPAFYRYDQSFLPPGGGKAITRRGFLALVKLVPLSAGIVLPHERTLTGPKEDRLKLFRATKTNLSPGFMLYRDPRGALDAPLKSGRPLTEFSTSDGIHHLLAKVSAKDAVDAIADGIAKSTLLIADGHHRYETAVRYSEEVNALHPTASPHAEHRYFMTFLVNGDDPNLVVFPTHRLVHSLAGFSWEDMVTRAGQWFRIESLPDFAEAPALMTRLKEAAKEGPSFVAASGDGRAVLLTLRGDASLASHPTMGQRPEVLRRTDVAVLHSGILEHILGITPAAQAAKTNLSYLQDAATALANLRRASGASRPPHAAMPGPSTSATPGTSATGGGEREGGQVLFLMNATPVADVRRVAEAGEVMPQKSTFFYPKVLTGLAIHTLDPSRQVAHPA
jgi:uncharacterized protein (DUF1015 family)